jgi:hypothetical protein
LISRKFSWKFDSQISLRNQLGNLTGEKPLYRKRSLEVTSDKSDDARSINQRVTIREVAAKAEVALSSVSRALSGHPDVSDEMRKRVKEVADELGYEPNLVAQSLRSGVTRTIGFVVRDINNPMFALLARSCEHELRRNGYSMILVNSDGNIENENRNFSLLRRRRVDGIIASLVSEDSPYLRKNLAGPRCPIVLLDREVKGVSASAVLADHAAGVHEAVTHLINKGHREIAFVTGSNNGSGTGPSNTFDGKFEVIDISSGSIANTYGIIGQITNNTHTGRGDFFFRNNNEMIENSYISIEIGRASCRERV